MKMNNSITYFSLFVLICCSFSTFAQSFSTGKMFSEFDLNNLDQQSQKKDELRVALPKIDNYAQSIRHKDEVLSDFLHEYWQLWAIDNKKDVRFVYINEEKIQQALLDNLVDIVAIRKTESKHNNNLLSIPYAKYTHKIFRRHISKNLHNVKIAIHAKDREALTFLNSHFSRTYYNDLDKLIAEQDKYDALYSTRPKLLEEKLTDKRLRSAFYLAKEDTPQIYFHFATRKSDRKLLYAINEGIKSVSRLQAQLWRSKYILDSDKLSFTFGNYLANMSESEKQFVIDHNQLSYPVIEGGTAPYIITDTTANIDVRGISIDITKIATEKTGILFKPLYVTNLKASLSALNDKEADMLLTASKSDAAKGFFSYSIPYISNYFSLTKRKDSLNAGETSNIDSLTIAIIKGLPATEVLKKYFPNANTKPFTDIKSALLAVQKKHVDIYIGAPLITDHVIGTEQLTQLHSIDLTNFPARSSLRFATLNKNKNLTTLLNKTLNSITSLQFNDMFAKWNKNTSTALNNKEEVATAYRNMSVILAITVIICLIIFWIYYRLLQSRKAAQIKVEQELTNAEEARYNAEQSAQAKVEFLARMSHEIRTPMNGVLGMAEAIAFTQLNGKQKELLETLNGSARNLLALLNNVLDFSKLDAGKLALESVPMALQVLSKNIVNGFKHIYKESEQKINSDISIELNVDNYLTHSYLGDPTRLTQVLNNLLSNAVKFTERGTISVDINIESIQTVRDKIYDTISFSVSDTGIGIEPEQQELLFTPFIQADSAITRKYGGTGLGLSICQEIVNVMGGEIKIKSAPGKGSCFYFQLKFERVPVNEEAEKELLQSARQLPQTEIDFEGVRVLVVEDNLVNVLVITAQLERLNIKPDVAENGQIALDKYREAPYDIIVSDCHMPIMDGFELASILKKEPKEKPLWVIAITAEALSGAADKCFKAGFDDFIAKPCPQEEISNKLNHAYRQITQ